VTQPRARRGLVPLEIALVLAIAVIPWPDGLQVGIPLVVAASLSRWLRGRSWSEVISGGRDKALVGAAVGVLALGIALLFGTPAIEAMATRGVEWSVFPMVRGSMQQMAMVLVLVSVGAIAAELAFRGWLVERVLELSPGPPILPVLCGALAEAVVMPGDFTARVGAGLFGAGLGWMYVASGRSVVAPILARIAFVGGAVVLEALRVIG
jgi:membrane protease YdiL (CAAX protease family)